MEKVYCILLSVPFHSIPCYYMSVYSARAPFQVLPGDEESPPIPPFCTLFSRVPAPKDGTEASRWARFPPFAFAAAAAVAAR